LTNVTDIDAVVCETHVNARPETVFAFFVEPDKMVRWMGTTAELDPRPGGTYRVDLNPTARARGTYLEVKPFERVVFSFGWEGDAIPAPGASTVEVTLTPDSGGTRVRLVHRGITNRDAQAQHREGWDLYLSRLAIAAAGGDPGPEPNQGSSPQ
jgi:uncharacterized protein YndB with AHSA1/START domain